MSEYDFGALKARQDAQVARAEKLLKAFYIFRQGFIEGLTNLIDECLKHEIAGLEPLVDQSSRADLVDASLMLNSYKLRLVSNNEAHFNATKEERGVQRLEARIFIYEEGDRGDVVTPMISIAIREPNPSSIGRNPAPYEAFWHTNNGLKSMHSGIAVTEEHGRQMAAVLLNIFYRLEGYWQVSPPLAAIRRPLSLSAQIIKKYPWE